MYVLCDAALLHYSTNQELAVAPNIPNIKLLSYMKIIYTNLYVNEFEIDPIYSLGSNMKINVPRRAPNLTIMVDILWYQPVLYM